MRRAVVAQDLDVHVLQQDLNAELEATGLDYSPQLRAFTNKKLIVVPGRNATK
jgi:hypothetical protein